MHLNLPTFRDTNPPGAYKVHTRIGFAYRVQSCPEASNEMTRSRSN